MPDPDAPELMAIGRFARLAGLSIGALRHYDEVGLLRPAEVDAFTGYRRYGADQLERARLLERLRRLDMPLDRIGHVLSAPDAESRNVILSRHLASIEARTARLQWAGHQLRQMIREETNVTAPTRPTTVDVDPAVQRQLAVDLFNRTWTLLETTERTREQDDEMIHAAHASRYHWGQVGGPVNVARGEWQLSRVYAVLRRGEPALFHARRCLEVCEEHGIGDFDLAFAHEALARAYAVAGQAAAAERHRELARDAGTRIAEAEDRELFESDLASIPT